MMDFPVQRFRKDEVIFEEGTVGGVAYIIKEGSVKVSVKGENKEFVLAILRQGSIFGEMALLLKDSKRTATITVLEDNTAVVLIHKKAFDEFVDQSPTIIGLLLNNLAERLCSTNDKLLKKSDVSVNLREIIDLLAVHNVDLVKYDELVESLSRFLEIETERIVEKLKALEDSKTIVILIGDDGKKLIKIQ